MSSASSTQSLHSAIDSLTEALRRRELVLVVGPEALTVSNDEPDGRRRQAPFYRLVAERLLASQHSPDLPLELLDAPGPSWDLHRACAAILNHTGLSAARLRRSVSVTIRELTEEVTPTGTLAALATLDVFSLIICLTPDDMLLRAIQAARPDQSVSVVSYSPRHATGSTIDVPLAHPGLLRLHHPLGRVENSAELAIHEEDAFEYLYSFRDDAERSAKTLMADLRSNDLLFVGCSYPEFLVPTFLRLARSERLSNTDRPMDFFLESTDPNSLTEIINKISNNSFVFYSKDINPSSPDNLFTSLRKATDQTLTDRGWVTNKIQASVFVSYASEDEEYSKKIVTQLENAGFKDIWFDKNSLRPGEQWGDQINLAINSCKYFILVLSKNADMRSEGEFLREWNKAIRISATKSNKFIIPIGIDKIHPNRMQYDRIYSESLEPLRHIHSLHAPEGIISENDLFYLSDIAQSPHG